MSRALILISIFLLCDAVFAAVSSPPPSYGKVSGATNRMMAAGAMTREFVLAHNKVRGSFNLPPLTWDKNLTRFARRWGKTRAVDCKMLHSYGVYGENLFWGKYKHWTAKEVVESWAAENKFYDHNSNQCAGGEVCGHYTQIIWKESTRLGCARVDCANGELLVICEYDPPGNYVNERPI